MNAPRTTVRPPMHCGSPCETDARLEVSPTVEPVIECPAGSVLAGQVDVSGGEIVVGLLVVRSTHGVCAS